jgi:predicted aspartyl protease
MAFTYRYAAANPPAPFVLVIVSNPDGTATAPDLPARVDTGADRTVIPNTLVGLLGLPEVGRLVFAGLAGQEIELPVYQVRLVVRDLDPILVEVAASDGEPHVLLGRDVLNRYRVVLDGPNGRLEIG